MGIQSLGLTHISRTGTFGQNDLLWSPPPSHCRQPHSSPNEYPPLRNASLALRFFLTININCYRSLLIFLFYYVYLFVYMWGEALMHACGGHTHGIQRTVLTSYSSSAPLWDPGSNSGCRICLEVSPSAICQATSAPFFLLNMYVERVPGSTRRYIADRHCYKTTTV